MHNYMDVEEIYRLECLVDEKNDEIERLRDENEKLRAIIDQLRGVFFNGVYIAESKVAKLNLARAALGDGKDG